MISTEISQSISSSVLCWLATTDEDGQPNVSPKEMFIASSEKTLLIANIASPNSVNNILQNPKVCVSCIDILKQKGYKLYGLASNITNREEDFQAKCEQLYSSCGGRNFTINSILEIAVTKTEPIVAPSYFLFPDTSESSIISQSLKSYGVRLEHP